MVKKFDDMCINLDTVLQRDGQADWRKEMVHQDRSVSMLTCSKKSFEV